MHRLFGDRLSLSQLAFQLLPSLFEIFHSSLFLLVFDLFKTDFLIPLLMDSFDQDLLVFVEITLGSQVEFVVTIRN
jgi:hypothetical protein